MPADFIIQQLQLMAGLDPETQAWLHSLKLNKKLTSVADFENGYNFGAIFDKLQLTRGKKFKNSNDLACVFQNYKNVKDLLLENFGCEFPVSNIIYRTEELLKAVRDEAVRYTERKKALTLKAATSTISNQEPLYQTQQDKHIKTREKQLTINSIASFNQTAKLPKKIQDIEKKLDKYREEKSRHELLALEERKQQLQQYKRIVTNNREYELNKVRQLHEQVKQKEKKVYDVWSKTQMIKSQRIDTDKKFQAFQKDKRDKLLQSLRNEEVETINQGLQMFQLNCMRQGIDLEHDPDKPTKIEGDFNKVVVMERIKDNIIKAEIDKKQRIKRENQKRIDAQEAKLQSEALWAEINKIQDYSKKFQAHFNMCEQAYKTQKRMEAERQTRLLKIQNKKFIELPAFGDQEARMQQFRQRKILYLYQDAQYIEKRYKKHELLAEDVVDALLQVVIEAEHAYVQKGGFTYGEWQNIQSRFMGYRRMKNKDNKLYLDYSNFNNVLHEYVRNAGNWKIFQSSRTQQDQSNQQLTDFIASAIDLAYPNKQLPVLEQIPLYMPLKMAFHGARLSGRSTQAARIAQKYGVLLINPQQLIKQALLLAKPPAEEDPKKAGKKDPKKVEQLTEEKIQLKQFGGRLLQTISASEQATLQHLIEAIKFKLRLAFKNKSQQEICEEYKAAKQKQRGRHEQAMKEYEQAQKKPKKDAKKGVEPAVEEPPQPNQCFYSTGFVLDDFPLTPDNLRTLERQMTGYISHQQKIDPQGTKVRRQLSLLLPIPQPEKDTRLRPGTFDALLCLQVGQQSLSKRRMGRKVDPATKQIYHASFNPAPEIKGFAEKLVDLPAVDQAALTDSLRSANSQQAEVKLFYSAFGIEEDRIGAVAVVQQENQTVSQTSKEISKFIQLILKSKYKQLESTEVKIEKINQQAAKKNEQNENKQQPGEPTQTFSNEPAQSVAQKQLSLRQLISQKLTMEQVQGILNKYLDITTKYEEGIKQCLFNLEYERNSFIKQLQVVQKKFMSLINRPDDKAGKILSFQENYNKLLAEQPGIVKDPEASKHLIGKLKDLYDSLWDSIGSKKNESVEQRSKFKCSDWLNTQAQRLSEVAKAFLQVELNYLCETVFLILTLACQLQQKPHDYVNEYLSLGIAQSMQPINSVSADEADLTSNKRLEYYINQTNTCLDGLENWIQHKFKKMKIQKIPAIAQLLARFAPHQVGVIQRRQLAIASVVSERVLEERVYHQVLLNKMDEWIIEGIKNENDFVYEIYKNIKKNIEEVKKSAVKELHVRDITEVYHPIDNFVLHPVPLRVETHHKRIPVYSFLIFLEQIKTLAGSQKKIELDIFKKYLEKRRKSKLLDPRILSIDYDTLEQYLVKDGYICLQQLALAVILWDVHVFDDDELTKYKAKLLRKEISPEQLQFKKNNSIQGEPIEVEENSSQISQKSGAKRLSTIAAFPIQHQITIDKLVLMDGAYDDEEEHIVKHIVFEIFREDQAEHIEAQSLLDALSMFDQLQVLRYGDTVMMLKN